MKKPRKKNPECLDETSPEDMEDDVCDKKETILKIITGKNNLNAYMTLPLLRRSMICDTG